MNISEKLNTLNWINVRETKGTIENEQSREIGNIGYNKAQDEDKTTQKNTTQYNKFRREPKS
jgi:hypothetical protein